MVSGIGSFSSNGVATITMKSSRISRLISSKSLDIAGTDVSKYLFSNNRSLIDVTQVFPDHGPPAEGLKVMNEIEGGYAGEEPEIVEVEEMEDHARVRSAFVQALSESRLGFLFFPRATKYPLPTYVPAKMGCQWAARKLFPWKGMPSKLATSGIVCHNFPDSVPFPGEDRPKSKTGSKGISDLSLADCSVLITAFAHPMHGLYFEQKPIESIGTYSYLLCS